MCVWRGWDHTALAKEAGSISPTLSCDSSQLGARQITAKYIPTPILSSQALSSGHCLSGLLGPNPWGLYGSLHPLLP